MHNVLRFAQESVERGRRVALVMVTAVRGSSPASAGQIMAVLGDGTSRGTVGGGASEKRLVGVAAAAIAGGATVTPFFVDHAAEGMTCGGAMEGFINVLGSGASLAIFGGGHIAQALARIAANTGFSVTVVEDRAEFADKFEHARYVLCEPGDYASDELLKECEYAVICTRGHATDAEALRYCVSKPMRYVGMIGSVRKSAQVLERLRTEGVDAEALGRVYTPIGLDIASQSPAEIAVAIIAEVLLVKNGGALRHKRL